MENTTTPLPAIAKSIEHQTISEAKKLPVFPLDFIVHYITTEAEANEAMANITSGVVGFDTEFMSRIPNEEEVMLNTLVDGAGGNKKSALLGLQLLNLHRNPQFEIQWDLAGLCVVQIANDNEAWVMNMTLMRAFPKELERVLMSADIIKAGVGVVNDIPVLWNDARLNLYNLVDTGLMAKLLLCQKYCDSGYSNLSMQISCAEILHCYVDKDQRTSDWKGELDQEQIEYSAKDAMISLRLFHKLKEALDVKEADIAQVIPNGWYTFNSKYGEPVRQRKTIRGEDINWATKDCPWFIGGKFQNYYQ
ncbi:ribonuclease H-like domain-containing protein [Mycena rebaudengoi]|nr:ribonuclease H-like domain-containing protein [Mycena rebaudengoi]